MIKTRLMKLMKGSGKYIAYNVFFQWISLLFQIAAICSAGQMIQQAYERSLSTERVLIIGGVILASVITRYICEKLAAHSSYHASARVKAVLRNSIYEKLLRLGVSYKEYVPTSEVVQVSTEGVEQLEIYYGRYLPQLLYSLLAPVTLFVFLSRISIKTCLILLMCVPLIPLSIVAVQKFAKRLLGKYWGIYTELGDGFLENLQGLTTLKIYQSDGKKAQEMDEESERFRKITMKVLTMQLNSVSVMDLVAYGGAAAGMIVTVNEYAAGNIDMAGAFSIILLAAEFFIPLRLLGSFFHIAMNGMSASDKIFRILDLKDPENGKRELFSKENEKVISVSIQNLGFKYEPERSVLKNISFEIPAGSFVSLVGRSGCGKSTVASLVTGKKHEFEGEILINGISIRNIKEEELMKNITLVRHDSYLFKGTVEENLRMASPDATTQEMESVLKKVNLYGFLSTQNGLRTELEEQGSNLSGGQRQRLAIARALLHDSPMYIFDEAASNIDVESEEKIMQVIRELASTKTVLFISHRLDNGRESDQICFLEEGMIVEQGTHDSLIEKKGKYEKMYHMQQELMSERKGASI